MDENYKEDPIVPETQPKLQPSNPVDKLTSGDIHDVKPSCLESVLQPLDLSSKEIRTKLVYIRPFDVDVLNSLGRASVHGRCYNSFIHKIIYEFKNLSAVELKEKFLEQYEALYRKLNKKCEVLTFGEVHRITYGRGFSSSFVIDSLVKNCGGRLIGQKKGKFWGLIG